MWGRATLAIEVSSTSMNAASATVAAISQGLVRGFHMACAVAARAAGPAGGAGLAGAAAPESATPDIGAEPAGVPGSKSANQILLGTDSALPLRVFWENRRWVWRKSMPCRDARLRRDPGNCIPQLRFVRSAAGFMHSAETREDGIGWRNAIVVGELLQQNHGERGQNPACREHHAQEPVNAAAGEEGNGGDDQANFEQRLAKIVAIRAGLGFFHLLFECFGLFLSVFQVIIPLGLVVGIGLGDLLGFVLVRNSQDPENVRGQAGAVGANLLGLVLVPLVCGLVLVEYGLGVGAMAEHGADG